MSRRYAQAIRIPATATATADAVAGSRGEGDRAEVRVEGQGPARFLWRGRLYVVRAVLAHWVEASPWWRSPGGRGPQGGGLPAGTGEREVWRVEAMAGRVAVPGVYDLCRDTTTGDWSLVRSLD